MFLQRLNGRTVSGHCPTLVRTNGVQKSENVKKGRGEKVKRLSGFSVGSVVSVADLGPERSQVDRFGIM